MMKAILTAALFIIVAAAPAAAEPSLNGWGLRYASINDGYLLEILARFSLGEQGFIELSGGSGERDITRDSVPVNQRFTELTAVIAGNLDLDIAKVYVGAGGSLVTEDAGATYGSPVLQAGIDVPVSARWGLVFDYRYQFYDDLSVLAAGCRWHF